MPTVATLQHAPVTHRPFSRGIRPTDGVLMNGNKLDPTGSLDSCESDVFFVKICISRKMYGKGMGLEIKGRNKKSSVNGYEAREWR